MSKVTLTLEENGDDVCVTLDLQDATRMSKAGRFANDLHGMVMQQVLLNRVPACYRHPPNNTIH